MSAKPATLTVLNQVLKDYYLPPLKQQFKQQLLWDMFWGCDITISNEKAWAAEWLTRILAYHGPMTRGHLGKLVREHQPGWTAEKLAKLARGMGWYDPKRRLYLLPDNHLAMEVRP